MYYTAYTPCFRKEQMSAGRDVRGIKRGHQFDKVEMYIFCKPGTQKPCCQDAGGCGTNLCRPGIGLSRQTAVQR